MIEEKNAKYEMNEWVVSKVWKSKIKGEESGNGKREKEGRRFKPFGSGR